VKSIGRQIGEKDAGVVASAILQLLTAGLKAGKVLIDDDEVPKPAQTPDAETRRDTRLRFEQWANNTKCDANVLSAVHGVPMATVARAEGLTPSMGQSPFALARGLMFEGRLFRNGAERLIPELARHGVLPEAKAEFLPRAEQAVGRPDVAGRGHDRNLRFWRELERTNRVVAG